MILKTLRVGKNSTGVIVKSQIVTSRKGCYMAKSKENTEIVPVTIQANDIGNLIYTIRDKQVMLDHDLAALYGYEVRALNQQVKRNIGRFPDDFMFQLTKDEVETVKSQIVTSPNSNFYSGKKEVAESRHTLLQSRESICWQRF